MAREQFTVNLNCPDCHAIGAAVWEENSHATPAGPQSHLISVHGDFHTERGRTPTGEPVIVCNNCDVIQAG